MLLIVIDAISSSIALRISVRTIWRIIVLYAVAVLVNFVWERAQSWLYRGMEDWRSTWWTCFIASLGDGGLLLLMYGIGWMVFRDANWFERPGKSGYVFMLVSGLAIGVVVEWVGLRVVRSWAYTSAMPLIPVLNLGLVPVLQMLLLPPAIFRIVAMGTLRADARQRHQR